MSVIKKTVVQFTDGKCHSLNLEVMVDDSDLSLVNILTDLKVALPMGDVATQRMIPECVDGDGLVFLTEVADGIYRPSVDDIEACYYDDVGLPPHVKNYYEGVVVFDKENFTEALSGGYESIISISIISN
jgi:hypothetical protein